MSFSDTTSPSTTLRPAAMQIRILADRLGIYVSPIDTPDRALFALLHKIIDRIEALEDKTGNG
jgi:hypothetical protein